MMDLQSNLTWDIQTPFQPNAAPFFTPQDFLGDSGEPYVIVNFQSPFNIIHASQEWLDLFRFSRDEVAGRGIQVIEGPGTDIASMKALVAAGQEGKVQEGILMVYSSACQGKLMRVTASPAVNHGQFIGCVLTMHHSDAILYKHACSEDGTAKAVVSARDPHAVEWVSSAFNRLYGLEEGQLNGRSLRAILGPNTDHRRWEALFLAGCAGQSTSGLFSTCRNDLQTLDVQVSISPVFSPEQGMQHLLVAFGSATAPSLKPDASLLNSTLKTLDQQPSHPAHAQDDLFRPVSASLSVQPHLIDYPPPSTACSDQPQAHLLAPIISGPPSSRAPQHVASLPTLSPRAADASSSTGTLLSGALASVPSAVPSSVVSHHTGTPTVFAGHTVSQTAPMLPLAGAPQALQSNLADFFGLTPSAAQRDSQPKGDTQSRVFPRRKQGQEASDASARGPVVITLDLLESFASLSLTAAAAKLGISPTAVKKACRKLGVQRWPYRKNAEPQSEQTACFDEAYVRKLYRKYSKSAKGAGRKKAPVEAVVVTPEAVPGAGGESVEEEMDAVNAQRCAVSAPAHSRPAQPAAQSAGSRPEAEAGKMGTALKVPVNHGGLQLATGGGGYEDEHDGQWNLSLGMNHGTW